MPFPSPLGPVLTSVVVPFGDPHVGLIETVAPLVRQVAGIAVKVTTGRWD